MNPIRLRAASSALLLLIVFTTPAHAQWSQFRGPNGSGVDSATGYPVEFSPTKNVAWKAAVPYGQSSPVIVGTRLYLTASVSDRLITLCLDSRTGKELWRRELKKDRPSEAFHANDPASPTPAADDNGVVAFFPDLGLVAYGPDGQLRWTVHLGPFKNFYGMAGSPIIAGGRVVLVCDQQPGAFIVALDRATGRQAWKMDRPTVRIGWSTPIVYAAAPNRIDIVVMGGTRLDAYDLATGALHWWMPIGSGDALGTAMIVGDTLLTSTLGSNEPGLPSLASTLAKYDTNKDGRLSFTEFSGDKEMGEHFGWIDKNNDKVIVPAEWEAASAVYIGEYGAIAVRLNQAQGQLPATAVAWRFKKNIPYIPAALVYQNVFYMVKTGGIVTSLDAGTGRLIKEGRAALLNNVALGEYYASPIAADGKVFISSNEGKITVLKAAGEWEVLAVNDLGDEIHATPALSEGRVYVRTRGTMYCFGVAR